MLCLFIDILYFHDTCQVIQYTLTFYICLKWILCGHLGKATSYRVQMSIQL